MKNNKKEKNLYRCCECKNFFKFDEVYIYEGILVFDKGKSKKLPDRNCVCKNCLPTFLTKLPDRHKKKRF